MNRVRHTVFRRFTRSLPLRLTAWGLALLAPGCAQLSLVTREPVVARGAAPEPEKPAPPKPARLPDPAPASPTRVAAATPARAVPINLDTVFRLAEGQNAQVALARARVNEACAEQDVAASAWVPNVYVGTAYFRHEGGIQNEHGNLVHSSFGNLFAGLEVNGRLDLREAVFQKVNAERRVWQQRGELSRVTTETLLDAAGTYVDLLAARAGEGVAEGLREKLKALLKKSEDLAKVEPGARVQVASIQTQLVAQEAVVAKLRDQAASASAKLAYLLGMDPCAELVPVDESLRPLALVDATPPVCDLVQQALTGGPGVREMEGLLSLIHATTEQANSRAQYLPTLEFRMLEGAFGAGPGASNSWDNRWDLGLQARWNLTELVTKEDRKRVLSAKVEQVHLAYRDLQGRLAAGVKDARQDILGGEGQIKLSDEQARNARRVYDLSSDRLQKNIPGSSAGEVLQSIQQLALAELAKVNAIRGYNKAQLRLLILTGAGAPASAPAPAAAP